MVPVYISRRRFDDTVFVADVEAFGTAAGVANASAVLQKEIHRRTHIVAVIDGMQDRLGTEVQLVSDADL